MCSAIISSLLWIQINSLHYHYIFSSLTLWLTHTKVRNSRYTHRFISSSITKQETHRCASDRLHASRSCRSCGRASMLLQVCIDKLDLYQPNFITCTLLVLPNPCSLTYSRCSQCSDNPDSWQLTRPAYLETHVSATLVYVNPREMRAVILFSNLNWMVFGYFYHTVIRIWFTTTMKSFRGDVTDAPAWSNSLIAGHACRRSSEST